jgi:hypothetical protein
MQRCECCNQKKHGVRIFKIGESGPESPATAEVRVCAECADDFQLGGTQANLWLLTKSQNSEEN